MLFERIELVQRLSNYMKQEIEDLHTLACTKQDYTSKKMLIVRFNDSER